MGSIVKAKVRKMEENTREGRSRRNSKDVMRCFQSMVGKDNFLVKFEDGQKIEMSYCLLAYVCLKQDVCLEMDELISDLP